MTVVAYELFKGERPFDPPGEHEEHAMRIYKRIKTAAYELKADRDDPAFQELIKLGFQIDSQRRPSALQLQQLQLFQQTYQVKRIKIPRRNQTIWVIPTHIVSANKMYVQISDENSVQFDQMQFENLQKIELKVVRNPGKN